MELAIPRLTRADLGVAKGFYVDGPGFRVSFEPSEDGRSDVLGAPSP